MADKEQSHDAGDSKPIEQKSEQAQRKAESNERGEINNSAQGYNEKLAASNSEQKVSGRSKATGAGADAYGKGGLASAKDLLDDLAHATLTKEAEKKSMSPQRKAELMAEIKRDGYIVGKPKEDHVPKGSAQDTGTVTDYRPRKNNEHFYSLGMNYDEGKQDTRNLGEKLSDFATAATRRATDPEGWQDWFDGQVQKAIGIGEGLNEAKEDTKTAVAAACKALTDGTVSNFLANPNAINEPLFKTVANVFDAVSSDPQATNKALEALGNAVIKSINEYSAMSKEEQGKVIGKTMFAMINPEGSTEGAEVALKIADKVATSVDRTVMDTIAASVKAAERAAEQSPELAKQTKQMLLDYLTSKGLSGPEFEYAGVPKSYFEGMQPSEAAKDSGILKMTGNSEGDLRRKLGRDSADLGDTQPPKDYPLTKLNQEDLGMKSRFEQFQVSKSMKDGIQTIFVEFVENPISLRGQADFSEFMAALKRNARAEGATTLRVECEFKNAELEEIWIKRHKPLKLGNKYITIKEL
ncbi:MAG: hypothetical protein K2X77_13645 [Candidatus Obscuribacterales bacterium]|nr:hypothetical protein [Candidatus Obscuribacterales bacterium]